MRLYVLPPRRIVLPPRATSPCLGNGRKGLARGDAASGPGLGLGGSGAGAGRALRASLGPRGSRGPVCEPRGGPGFLRALTRFSPWLIFCVSGTLIPSPSAIRARYPRVATGHPRGGGRCPSKGRFLNVGGGGVLDPCARSVTVLGESGGKRSFPGGPIPSPPRGSTVLLFTRWCAQRGHVKGVCPVSGLDTRARI